MTCHPGDKRGAYRHCLQVPLTLEFAHGARLSVSTRDVSMDGLFVESGTLANRELVGQCGSLDIPFRSRQKTFEFEVVRVTEEGMGLQITNQLGMFGKIIVEGVFGDVF